MKERENKLWKVFILRSNYFSIYAYVIPFQQTCFAKKTCLSTLAVNRCTISDVDLVDENKTVFRISQMSLSPLNSPVRTVGFRGVSHMILECR